MLLASQHTLSHTCFVKYHPQHQLHAKSSSIFVPQVRNVWLLSLLAADNFLFLSGLRWGSRLLSPDMSCISTRLCSAWPWYGPEVGFSKLRLVSPVKKCPKKQKHNTKTPFQNVRMDWWLHNHRNQHIQSRKTHLKGN